MRFSYFSNADNTHRRRGVPVTMTAFDECGANKTLIARLREPIVDGAETGVSAYARMPGGLADVERAACLLLLTEAETDLDDPAPTAAAVFDAAGDEPLAQASAMWRDLLGVTSLIGEEGFDAAAARPKVETLVANACGHEDFDALISAVAETASAAAARIDALRSRA